MKKKTYRWVLGLFLTFFYALLISFCVFNVKKDFSRVKESYLREHYFLTNNMLKSLLSLERKNYNANEAIKMCYKDYKKQYEDQEIYLQVYQGEECLYTNVPQEITINMSKNIKDKEKREVGITKIGSLEYIRVSGYLPEQYNEYAIVSFADISKIVAGWRQNITSIFIISTIFTGILSICLLFLFEYLFKPLEIISDVSMRIAGGNYEERLHIKGEGEIAQVVKSFNSMSSKITDQMQTLKNNATEKQMLIDNLAHELRTPLTAIYGYAEYMQKTKLQEEDKYVSTQFILDESRRLKSISEMLLDMAALREEAELEKKNIYMKELLYRIEKLESIKMNEKEIEYIYKSTFDKLYGNEDLVESLLVNLIDNAIKACYESGVRIILNAYEQGDEKVIEVIDNGKGMTEEETSHITEAFYRVDKARSRSEGGNGLGLALCDEIAKKHHARLEFISKLYEGTKVRIIFEDEE